MSQEQIKTTVHEDKTVQSVDNGHYTPEPKPDPQAQREAALRTGKVVSMTPYRKE